MSEGKKILPLTVIAQQKKLTSAREALAALIPYDIIHAYLEEVTHFSGQKIDATNITSSSMNLRIPEAYLNIIFIKGAWEGNRIQVQSFDVDDETPRLIGLTLAQDTRISVEDLFVYEHDLVDLETQNPGIFAQGPIPSTRTNGMEEMITPVAVNEASPQQSLTGSEATPAPLENNSSGSPKNNIEKNVIHVPRSLWEGKPYATVRNAMRPQEEGGEGFSDSIIAYILFNWCGLTNKTQLGRLLGKPCQDDSSYRRLTTRLLKKAASFTIMPD